MNLFRPALALTLVLLLGAPAFAQPVTPPQVTTVNAGDLFQDIPNGISGPTNVYASGTQLRSFAFGGSASHSGVPVLTSCITGGGTIKGTDYAFILTGGSTASTSCVATFATAFVATPICTVVSQTAYATTTPSYTVSTTAVTITQASQSSEVYDVICVAQPGG